MNNTVSIKIVPLIFLLMTLASWSQPSLISKMEPTSKTPAFAARYTFDDPQGLELVQSYNTEQVTSKIIKSLKVQPGTTTRVILSNKQRKQVWVSFPNGAVIYRQTGIDPVRVPVFAYTPAELFATANLQWNKQGEKWIGSAPGHHVEAQQDKSGILHFKLSYKNFSTISGSLKVAPLNRP